MRIEYAITASFEIFIYDFFYQQLDLLTYFLGRKSSSSESSSESENSSESEAEYHPLVTVSNIDPKEIPDVPQPKFLYRKVDNNEKEDSKKKKDKDSKREDKREAKKRAKIRGYTKSGRVIKGRGVLVCFFFS